MRPTLRISDLPAHPAVFDGSRLRGEHQFDTDVCVIGTGAGGALAGAMFAQSGRQVLFLEAGGLYGARDFTMRERETVPRLYQDALQRATADGAVTIMQGKAVGGSTVVNYTVCFRTPQALVVHWRRAHAVGGFAYEDLLPHFAAVERRLCIAEVPSGFVNANNEALRRGCERLGFETTRLKRNVTGCLNTGYCGQGCPVHAKRSALVTFIPEALAQGARLVQRASAERLVTAGRIVQGLEGHCLSEDGSGKHVARFRVRARKFVLAGGAINSPALLLRSGLDRDRLVGARTFLHPTIGSLGVFEQPIEAFHGAPQSIVSFQFAKDWPKTDGFVLEAVPTYPASGAAGAPGAGAAHYERMALFGRTAVHSASFFDGFSTAMPGGRVSVKASGAPSLEYGLNSEFWALAQRAQRELARIQIASGAQRVMTLHDPPVVMTSEAELSRLDAAPWRANSIGVYSGHQMGGCAMGDDPKHSVVRSDDLRHHDFDNLHVMDGSVFPTSLGVNPQQSIYALVGLMSQRLIERWSHG